MADESRKSAVVRILAANNGAVLASVVLAVAQTGDSFTFKADAAADYLFTNWRAGHLVEVIVRNEKGNREKRWTCAEPKIGDDEVTLDAKAVGP